MAFTGMTLAQSMAWQTATAAIQATCSVGLLCWYLWAAHLERARARRERADAFASLVYLCHDLGFEAKDRTKAYLASAREIGPGDATDAKIATLVADWKLDMAVLHVCLSEAPHYEVRNPAFSTALTRLWMEVDAREVRADDLTVEGTLVAFLERKYDRICAEVDAMARLAKPCGMRSGQTQSPERNPRRAPGKAKASVSESQSV